MAKISYLISRNSKRSGKSIFHFDGSGSGSWFSKWFNKDHEEVSSTPNDIKDLISKLVSEFDGNSESVRETRIEFEGSSDEIQQFASWSIGEIKANADSLKDLAAFTKSYCESIGDMSIKIYRGFVEADNDASDIQELKNRVSELEAAQQKKSKKAE